MREMLVQILFNEQIILLIKVSKRNVLKFWRIENTLEIYSISFY